MFPVFRSNKQDNDHWLQIIKNKQKNKNYSSILFMYMYPTLTKMPETGSFFVGYRENSI